MSADIRLLHEVTQATLFLMSGGNGEMRRRHDALHACMIAARTETLEANDAPAWPQEAAAEWVSADAVLAYAARLQAALLSSGIRLEDGTALALARQMLRAAPTAVAPDTDAPVAAWEPSDEMVRECAAREYAADCNVSAETARARIPKRSPTHPIYRKARAALRYAREQFGAEAEGLRIDVERYRNGMLEGVKRKLENDKEIATLRAQLSARPAQSGTPGVTVERLVEIGGKAWDKALATDEAGVDSDQKVLEAIARAVLASAPAAPGLPEGLRERLPPEHFMATWCNAGWLEKLTNEHLRALHELIRWVNRLPTAPAADAGPGPEAVEIAGRIGKWTAIVGPQSEAVKDAVRYVFRRAGQQP